MKYDFIPSEYYRKFCEKNGIEFTDREKAAIIRGCPAVTFGNQRKSEAALYIRLKKLGDIAAKTDDGELKAEIEDLTAFYQNKLELLKDNSDNSCVYLVVSGEHSYFYSSFEKAFEAGMSCDKSGFTIYKERLADRAAATDQYQFGVIFDSNGNLLQFNDIKEMERDLQNKAIPLKNPFERGDIVMDCYTRQIGVVETSREKWEAKISDPDLGKLPFSFVGIEVDFFSPLGLRFTTLISPLTLEKVEDLDQTGDEAELLRCASNILSGNDLFGRGSSTLFDLFNLYDKVKENGGNGIFAKNRKSAAQNDEESSTTGHRVAEENMQRVNQHRENEICRFYVPNEEARKIPDMNKIHSFKQLAVLNIYNALSFEGIRGIYIFGISTKDRCSIEDDLDIAFDMTVSRDDNPQLYNDLCAIVSRFTDGKCCVIFLNENRDKGLTKYILKGAKIYESNDQ